MSSWHGRRKKDSGYRGGPDREMTRLLERAYGPPPERVARAMARRKKKLPDSGKQSCSPPAKQPAASPPASPPVPAFAKQPAASSPARSHAVLPMVADSSWLTFLTLVGTAALIAWARYG